MEKQVNCDKTTLQTRRVWQKKDLISSKDYSHPSKHLAFLSLQIHHIKQCGTSLQIPESLNAYIAMMSKLTLPRLKQLNYLMWYNPVNSKQTNKTPKTTTQMLWGSEEEGDSLTPHTS